jgi:ABC-2 type transport system ATP-binding protein
MRADGVNPEKIILADQLTKKFDEFIAVDKVSFSVSAGQILVILGPNGAGKTTTIRMLTSILAPTSGRAEIAGYDVVKQPDKVRASVGVLTEHHGLYGRMSALEYLDFFAQLYNLDKKLSQKRIKELLGQFGLMDALNKRLGEYSKGMRQKLALVRAMLHDPPVLLLDEPTSALDPESARIVRETILSLRTSDRAVVLCTHNLVEAEYLADQIAIIRYGKIILNGAPEEIKKAYFGPVEYEAHLAAPLNGWMAEYPEGITLVAQGSDWLRFRCENPQTANPVLLRQLLSGGLGVITFKDVARSLEQVYTRAINQADGEAPNAR